MRKWVHHCLTIDQSLTTTVSMIVLYHYDCRFTHLENFDQKKYKKNLKIQKKNIFGERFFWL